MTLSGIFGYLDQLRANVQHHVDEKQYRAAQEEMKKYISEFKHYFPYDKLSRKDSALERKIKNELRR